MRFFVVIAIVASFFAAWATQIHAEERKGPPTARTDEQKKQDAEIDKEYQRTMKMMRGREAETPKYDPWGVVRPATADNKKH